MAVESFYMGPDSPHVRVRDWADLVAAAQSGSLTENQWVERKKGIPEANKVSNLELARDLASLTVDGGVLVIGVKDAGDSADAVVGTRDDISSLITRISQVAQGTRVQPPMQLSFAGPFDNPADSDQKALIVVVPRSASAPHMVDERFWGRGAEGKRPLAEAEVARLFLERRRQGDDLAKKIIENAHKFDPFKVRSQSHAFIVIEPDATPSLRTLDHVALRQNFKARVLASQTFTPKFPPGLSFISRSKNAPDGIIGESGYEYNMDEDNLYRLYVRSNGAIWVLSGRVTRTNNAGDRLVLVRHAVEAVHQALELAGYIGRHVTAYEGTWSAGIYIDFLRGTRSSEFDSFMSPFGEATEFQDETYVRTTGTTTTELSDRASVVNQRLLDDFTRSLDSEDIFPYTHGSEIARY